MQMTSVAAIVCACAAAAATPALAQDDGIRVSAGVRAWLASWTTFTYAPPNFTSITSVAAGRRLVMLPSVAVRAGDFSASFSGMPSTTFDLAGATGSRREYDLALGWSPLPGLTVSAGYKQVLQRDGVVRYEPKGPFLGFAGDASVNGPLSLYGQVAFGWLRTSGAASANDVSFETDYRVSEVGLAYSLVGGSWVRRWRLSLGFRIQQMRSREAAPGQDGIDGTDGFTFGAAATF